jgi:hypothetical protein
MSHEADVIHSSHRFFRRRTCKSSRNWIAFEWNVRAAAYEYRVFLCMLVMPVIVIIWQSAFWKAQRCIEFIYVTIFLLLNKPWPSPFISLPFWGRGWDFFSKLLPLMDVWVGERWWNYINRRNRRTRRKTYPSATLSATNPTWIDSWANLGLRCEGPATNHLGHGTAHMLPYSTFVLIFPCFENSTTERVLLNNPKGSCNRC